MWSCLFEIELLGSGRPTWAWSREEEEKGKREREMGRCEGGRWLERVGRANELGGRGVSFEVRLGSFLLTQEGPP